jgi:uncharacterized membrane protein
MKNCKSILCLLVALATTVTAAAADAPPLALKFTTVNVPGAVQTFPGGINDAGVMVGQYEDKSGIFHGYILNGKKLTTLDDPKGTGTLANGINLEGAISVVGAYTNSTGLGGFLYRNGKYADIPGPSGAVSVSANGINDSGAIVGSYRDASGASHGFLLTDQKYTTLDVPGATIGSFALGINNLGWIVLIGESSTTDSFLTKDNGKTYTMIDFPFAVGSQATDIDTAGDVTYLWLSSIGNYEHGGLLHAGKYYGIRYPKSVLTYAAGINDKSVIVGVFRAKNSSNYSGFKATYK